ncbi:MAG: hypothetical protein AAFZ15_27570, partial [Bacteroidota bacterium]
LIQVLHKGSYFPEVIISPDNLRIVLLDKGIFTIFDRHGNKLRELEFSNPINEMDYFYFSDNRKLLIYNDQTTFRIWDYNGNEPLNEKEGKSKDYNFTMTYDNLNITQNTDELKKCKNKLNL